MIYETTAQTAKLISGMANFHRQISVLICCCPFYHCRLVTYLWLTASMRFGHGFLICRLTQSMQF